MGNARKITPTATNDAVRTKEHINVTMHVEFSYFFAWIGRDAGGGILLLDVYTMMFAWQKNSGRAIGCGRAISGKAKLLVEGWRPEERE